MDFSLLRSSIRAAFLILFIKALQIESSNLNPSFIDFRDEFFFVKPRKFVQTKRLDRILHKLWPNYSCILDFDYFLRQTLYSLNQSEYTYFQNYLQNSVRSLRDL